MLYPAGCSIWFLMSGMSTVLIISTVNNYLKSMGAPAEYMGYVMAGYSVGGIIAAPAFGYLADYTRSIRSVMISSIICNGVSYAVYFYFPRPNAIILARILAGIAFG